MSEDGISMNTFLSNVRRETDTILLLEDSHGHKFGGFLLEEWSTSTKFFGSGESFVFTFGNGNDCTAYYASGNNQMY